jgi:dTDP-4-amino-4,6-dideoxy-D-galactose acyltransferase
VEDYIEFRKEILYHYAPLSFFHKVDKERIFKHSVADVIGSYQDDSDIKRVEIVVKGYLHVFFLKYLPWDTSYFNIPTYKLTFILYKHQDYNVLKRAVEFFTASFFTDERAYCFSELPSEDIFTIQALNASGFKLVENRLTYYLNLLEYNYKERFQVRSASFDDITNLKQVARSMRNVYDRFHAESVFDIGRADEFLATYIEESIKGYADYTMVPSGEGVRPDAFLTANYLSNDWAKWGIKVSKMVLSAVSSTNCKGWYIKLISEMAYHLRSVGADYAFMHPATTNRAVINTYEKLGCKYGKCVHILTYHHD